MRSMPFIVVIACGLAAVHAVAEDAERQPGPGGRNPAEAFKRADGDGDGKVSKDEFMKARSAEAEQMFGRIDANGDGFIEPEEARKFMESMRGSMAGREGGPRPGGDRRPEGGPRPEGGLRPEGQAPRGPGGGPGDEAFQRLDRDGNGQLSREEFEAGMMRMREMMQRNGMGQLPGRPAGPGGAGEGFRRPPEQDGAGRGPGRPEGEQRPPRPE